MHRLITLGVLTIALAGGLGSPAAQAVSQPPKPYFPNSPNGPIVYSTTNNLINAVAADGTTTPIFQGGQCLIIRDLAASPGTAAIAFVADDDPLNADGGCNESAQATRVYTMANDGSGLKVIASVAQVSQIAWSPDGARLVLADDGNLSLLNADGSGRTSLGVSGAYGGVDWSPDGTTIAYETYLGVDHYALKTLGADGTGGRTILADTRQPLADGIYPSGRAIWLSNNELAIAGSTSPPGTSSSSACVIVGLSTDTAAVREITRTPAGHACDAFAHYEHSLQRSPDGSTIAFLSFAYDSASGGYEGSGTLYDANASGGDPALVPVSAGPDQAQGTNIAMERIVYGPPPRRGRR